MNILEKIENRFGKKTVSNVLIAMALLGIVMIASLPAFRSGVYKGFDLWFPMGRIESIAYELSHGQIPVRYDSTAWYGNGYISSTMYGNIFLYFPALLTLLGVPTYRAYNVYVITINIVGVIIGYYSFRRTFNSKFYGVLGAGVYYLSAYYITNIYMRSDVGEATAMAFCPLVVYGMYRIYFQDKEKGVRNVLPLVIGMTGIIQSHVISGELIVFTLILFCLIYFRETVKKIPQLLLAVIVTFAANAFFIIPFLDCYLSYDLKAEVGSAGDNLRAYGLYLDQILGLFPEGSGDSLMWTSEGEEFVRLGILHVVCIVAMVAVAVTYRIFSKEKPVKKEHKLAVTVLIMGILASWISSAYFPWEIFMHDNPACNMIRAIQYPGRYLLIQTLCYTFVGVYAFRAFTIKESQKISIRLKKTVIIGIIAVLAMLQNGIFYYTLSCRIETVQSITDRDNFFDALYFKEDTDKEKILKRAEVLNDGECVVKDLGFVDGKRAFSIENGTDKQSIVIPVLDYKYVYVKDSSGNTLVTKSSDNHQLIIEIDGGFTDKISVGFEEPLLWRLSEIISITCVLFIIAVSLKKEG